MTDCDWGVEGHLLDKVGEVGGGVRVGDAGDAGDAGVLDVMKSESESELDQSERRRAIFSCLLSVSVSNGDSVTVGLKVVSVSVADGEPSSTPQSLTRFLRLLSVSALPIRGGFLLVADCR